MPGTKKKNPPKNPPKNLPKKKSSTARVINNNNEQRSPATVERPLSGARADQLEFWESLPDADYFGSAVKHLYFYSSVNDDSVLNLREEVLSACRVSKNGAVHVAPKPILIHIHSYGGSTYSENWLLSLFNHVRVPLCAMVDQMSASAATSLSVMAPYRVGLPHSMSLLHDYATLKLGKREKVLADVSNAERHRTLYKDLYLARTAITDRDMEALLRRDLWLDAKECLRLGIYDRIVAPDRSAEARHAMATKYASLPDNMPFIKHNWNTVYSMCDSGPTVVEHLDILLSFPAQEMRPIVYIAPGDGDCDDITSAAAIARIQASPVPVFGIVDNQVSWWDMLPILHCHRRYMYETAVLESAMVYTSAWGERLQDIVANANKFRSVIQGCVRERGRPTPDLLNGMFDRHMFLTAEDCLRNGLVDEIIRLDAGRPWRRALSAGKRSSSWREQS